MKHIYTHACMLLIFVSVNLQVFSQANPSSSGNFGNDGDLFSGERLSGSFTATSTDDWFIRSAANVTGLGVIDTSGSSLLKNQLQSGGNPTFSKGMTFARYSVQNGRLMLDARYIHDNIGQGGSAPDHTVFTSGSKNGMSPTTWVTNPGGAAVIDKTDIVDGYVHMRRNGTILSGSNPDHLFLYMGASTVGTTGNRFIDLELYKSRITYNANGTFTNAGASASGGHTPWQFNSNGSISSIGDMDCTFDFSSASITDVGVYLWVSKTTVESVVPSGFDFVGVTEFYGDGQNATYGYAKIKPKNGASLPVYGSVNTSATSGPNWGTNSKDFGSVNQNYYSTQYAVGQFAEVGIDLTALGVDVYLTSSNNPCVPPYTRMMIKSRSSSSFTSALSDFTGPYEFLDAPQISPAILNPGKLSCNITSVVLKPASTIGGASYVWSTSNGNIVNISNGGTQATISKPGKYYLDAAPSAGCVATRDSVEIVGDYYKPVASANRTGVAGVNPVILLYGGDPLLSNYQTPFGGSQGLQWSWSGPSNFTSLIQNPTTTFEGNYRLIVTETRNGCKDTATVYVPSALVLPVRITEFTGAYINKSASLKWVAENESGIDHYELQKSEDGIHFTKLTDKVAVNSSASTTAYKHTDANVKGATYYRLKIYSIDGKSDMSKIVAVNASGEIGISVFPNPAVEKINVNLEARENVTAQILDMSGRKVSFSKLLGTAAGISSIDVSKLNPGMYTLVLQKGSSNYTFRFLKQ